MYCSLMIDVFFDLPRKSHALHNQALEFLAMALDTLPELNVVA